MRFWFEEIGLYYIGSVDGHNIEDLICVFIYVNKHWGTFFYALVSIRFQEQESKRHHHPNYPYPLSIWAKHDVDDWNGGLFYDVWIVLYIL